jgi:hypothetical protein
MDGGSGPHENIDLSENDSFPASLKSGTSVLVASAGDPAEYAVSLRILCNQGTAKDTALLVTTTENAEQTIERYEHCLPETERPSLGIVDTTSQQSISALYCEPPIVFTPSPGDLERLVLGLSDLSEKTAPAEGAQHLVIRSLTPILDVLSADRVETVLEKVVELRSETGLSLFGIDYTSHDEETMAAVANSMDGVLWVTQLSETGFAFDYQPRTDRYSSSALGGGTGD